MLVTLQMSSVLFIPGKGMGEDGFHGMMGIMEAHLKAQASSAISPTSVGTDRSSGQAQKKSLRSWQGQSSSPAQRRLRTLQQCSISKNHCKIKITVK